MVEKGKKNRNRREVQKHEQLTLKEKEREKRQKSRWGTWSEDQQRIRGFLLSGGLEIPGKRRFDFLVKEANPLPCLGYRHTHPVQNSLPISHFRNRTPRINSQQSLLHKGIRVQSADEGPAVRRQNTSGVRCHEAGFLPGPFQNPDPVVGGLDQREPQWIIIRLNLLQDGGVKGKKLPVFIKGGNAEYISLGQEDLISVTA